MKTVSIFYQTSFSKDYLLGTVEIILAFCLAGSTLIPAKMLSTRVPVFIVGVLSLLIALVCMLPVQWARRGELKKINRGELMLMFFQALFGIVLFRVFTLFGLRYTSAANAAIITSATPAVMVLFSIFFLKEKLRGNILIGVLAALCALGLINVNGAGSDGLNVSLFGNFLIGMAVISEVLLTIFRKATRSGISSITNTTILILFSIVLMSPMAVVELISFNIGSLSQSDWLGIIYYGAVATAGGYILWGDGAMRIPASFSGVACVFIPISGLVLSHLILDETFSQTQLIGSGLAIFGMLACNLRFTSLSSNKRQSRSE